MTVGIPVFGLHPLGLHLRNAILMLEPASILTLEVSRRLPPKVHKGNPGSIRRLHDGSITTSGCRYRFKCGSYGPIRSYDKVARPFGSLLAISGYGIPFVRNTSAI